MPKKTILIVADLPSTRETLHAILDESYATLNAGSGAEALALLRERAADLWAVVMDMALPDMDGYEAIRQLYAEGSLRQAPIIVITAAPEEGPRALELGAADFVSAPYLPDVLLCRVQNAIRQREAAKQFEIILQNANSSISAVAITDNVVRFVFANDQYYSLLGFTRAQFEAEVENAFMLLHPEDRERIAAVIDGIYASGGNATYEYRCYRRDGSLAYLRCSASMAHLGSSGQRVLLSIITDITEQKQTEQALEASSARLEAIVGNIASGVTAAVVGEDNKVQYFFVTDRFYELLGYTREQYEQEVTDPFGPIHVKDVPWVIERVQEVNRTGESATMEFRAFRRDGQEIWLQDTISLFRFADMDETVQLSVFTDITERKRAEDDLRMSEELFRIAAQISEQKIGRYDIATGTHYHDDPGLAALGFPSPIQNVPQAFVDAGMIAPECVVDFVDFYHRLGRGEKSCAATVALRLPDGAYHWIHAGATVIFDAEAQPSQAIIVFSDITEQREKEAAFQKMQNDLEQRPPESYTFFRWNLSRDMTAYAANGALIRVGMEPGPAGFNERSKAYAEACVYPQDRETYLSLVNADTLLAGYYRGRRTASLEYREMLPDMNIRWLRLTVELVEYQQSPDVEAYLMYEDIDAEKATALQAKALADSDPLTGVPNRTTFVRRMTRLIEQNKAGRHTLLMLDIDGFKLLNDAMGHAVGDQALIDIAHSLRSILRQGDLLGRLGGDEFVICLKDVPYDAVIEKKARQICTLVRRVYSPQVQITASIGIAVYPDDGEDFDTLYRNADAALYNVKGSGKDNFAYYNREIERSMDAEGAGAETPKWISSAAIRRRMLIVDDQELNRTMLSSIFQDEFVIETANDGASALVRMRHYGPGLSIVLLDLVMPGIDGFEVLQRMQESVEMRTIPVIVVSGQDEREASLKAIQHGAADYITKPVDPAVLRLRVQSAISRAENERLRAQNSYLLLQSGEEARYRTVLESTGTVVIEYDWLNGVFAYDASIGRHIAGRFDNRRLWHILLSDLVADALDVKAMQELVHAMADDRTRESGGMTVKLKTPSGARQWFRMQIFKRMDDYQLTDKMIITFMNVNEEMIADEKLRFQAERDGLTGLYNRRTFLHKVEEMVVGSPANAYLMSVGDIDGFKMINDKYGHAEGDKLLLYVADRLREDVQKANGLCGRLGSDVFATLVPNTAAAVERTHDYPRTLLSEYPLKLETTFSIGYYIIDTPTMSADGMLDRASMAKQTVKGRYETKVALYDENMRQALLTEQAIASSMEDALRNGLFDIYLQPQFNHATGQIDGAEALVRWLHPDKGILFHPGEFIPLFEKNGFIIKLDDYVWNAAAALLRKWLSNGSPVVPISVNVSRLDTHDSTLCERLLAILKRNEVPLDLFRLEITESLFEEDSERLVAVINKLHEAGFLIEMDDFGSGYSSLNVLKDVPVDVLKLDMRFFSDTDYNERSGMILNAVMRMARWLGIPVIAEGVETRAQADYLSSIGCPVVQGYLYAAPMPVERFEALLQENAAAPRKPEARQSTQGKNSANLWALRTLDSELFYSYMGAAMIYEYRHGEIELVRLNRQVAALLELSSDAAISAADTFLDAPGTDFADLYAATARAVETNSPQQALVRHTREDGTVRTLLCMLRVMPQDGDAAVLICCMEDITEHVTPASF